VKRPRWREQSLYPIDIQRKTSTSIWTSLFFRAAKSRPSAKRDLLTITNSTGDHDQVGASISPAAFESLAQQSSSERIP